MSMPPSGSRLLAPAPPPNVPVFDAAFDPPGSPLHIRATGIKRASTACQSCKQIKRKCDQSQPCSNCRKSRTQCVYSEAEDGRRKAARKRTVESLELNRDALDSILESLRASDDNHVQTLVRLIRSGAPLDEIVNYATTHADTLPESQLHSIRTVAHGQPRKSVLSVTDLCDTPLVRVPSRPWTMITEDDEFVSHLISIYFTRFHVAYPVVDKGLFLRDMGAGATDCQFCSPFLVNAMLAIACHFSDHPRACREPSDASTRGRHFLEEAVRLWNEQGGIPTVVNIQAVSVLAVVSTLVGRDRMSWAYVEQMNKMQQELSIKTRRAEERGLALPSSAERQSQSIAARAVFVLTVGYGIAFMKDTMSSRPSEMRSMHRPVMEQHAKWFPYPQQTPELDVAFSKLYDAQFALHEIGFDIQHLLFGNTEPSQGSNVSLLDDRLREWYRSLPEPLQIGENASLIKPPVMDLHLTYHWLRITLFEFVKKPQSRSSSQLNFTQTDARSLSLESVRAIADLCRYYARDFGLKQPTMWMPQTTATAAYSLLDVLSDPDQASTVEETFHELCLVLIAASHRWLVMKGHVRMIYLTAQEKGLVLPVKTTRLLKLVASDKWGDTDHLYFASASYPNYALAKGDDPRLAAMGDLLEKWANFEIKVEEEVVVETARTSIADSHLSGTDQE